MDAKKNYKSSFQHVYDFYRFHANENADYWMLVHALENDIKAFTGTDIPRPSDILRGGFFEKLTNEVGIYLMDGRRYFESEIPDRYRKTPTEKLELPREFVPLEKGDKDRPFSIFKSEQGSNGKRIKLAKYIEHFFLALFTTNDYVPNNQNRTLAYITAGKFFEFMMESCHSDFNEKDVRNILVRHAFQYNINPRALRERTLGDADGEDEKRAIDEKRQISDITAALTYYTSSL